MNEVCEMLKKAGTYFIATCEDGQPRVRPFGTAHIYNGKLYIQTGKSKAVSRQLHQNPKLEICAMLDGGEWLHFDFVPEEHQLRRGSADYTGRLCVIGSHLDEAKLSALFGL